MSEYVLGVNDSELARLRQQNDIWSEVTEAFLDRVEPRAGHAAAWRGARVLDLGAGPGFVSASLRARVGGRGHVVALDESPRWIEHVRATVADEGWDNVEVVCSKIEQAQLAPASFDLVFARWVLSFVPRPEAVVERVARALRPGGVLAIQDYNHEGISLFPRSAGFEAMIRATRELYGSGGGDPWIAVELPRLFRAAGLELVDYTPHVICGGPDSAAFRWADAFFPSFSAVFEERGLVSPAERAQFLSDWEVRRADPDTRFFSPMVIDAAARKPG